MTDERQTPDSAEAGPPAAAEQKTKDGASPANAATQGETKSGSAEGKAEERGPDRPRIPPARARWGLRLLVLLVVLLVLFLLLWWKHCFPGKGGGGRDSARDSGPAAMAGAEAAPGEGPACLVRVDAKGIAVAGQPTASSAAAIQACGAAKRAVLTVTGDATFGTAAEVEKALRAAGIAVQRQR